MTNAHHMTKNRHFISVFLHEKNSSKPKKKKKTSKKHVKVLIFEAFKL